MIAMSRGPVIASGQPSPLVGEGAREAGGRGATGRGTRHPPPVVSQSETTPSPTRGEGWSFL